MSVKQPVTIVAKLLNLTRRRIQQLAQGGIIPNPENGKYDLIACLTGYIKYLRKCNAKKEN
jgi:hypothetical protein